MEFSLRVTFSVAVPQMAAPSLPLPMGRVEVKLLAGVVYQEIWEASKLPRTKGMAARKAE